MPSVSRLVQLLVFFTSPELLFFAMVISRLGLSKVVLVLLIGVFLLMIFADCNILEHISLWVSSVEDSRRSGGDYW